MYSLVLSVLISSQIIKQTSSIIRFALTSVLSSFYSILQSLNKNDEKMYVHPLIMPPIMAKKVTWCESSWRIRPIRISAA